jgi:molybdenum cofactor cytidylyltransferase
MTQKKPTAGIILAAGASKRFGQPKQLLKLKDKYLIEWIIDASLASKLEKAILVLGHSHQTIMQVLAKKACHSDLKVVINPNYKNGQSLSLKIGLSNVEQAFPSVMFLLGDQPMVDSTTINHLLETFWSSEKDICVPKHRGKKGNPTIFGQGFYPHIKDIEGDIGARQLIEEYPDHVLEVEIQNPLCFFDIDTEQDYETLKHFIRSSEGGARKSK